MGQKSNINTLKITSNQNIQNTSIKLNLINIVLTKYLKFLLNKKGFSVFNISISIVDSRISINIKVFYNTQKLIFIRKLKKRYLKTANIKYNIFNIIQNFLYQYKINLFDIKIININKDLDKKVLNKVYLLYRKHLNTLFDKKFYMCIDLTKITTLFLYNRVPTQVFLEYISKVFSYTHKKNHVRYLKMISTIFKFLIKGNANLVKIKGIRLFISGKLLGKTMASNKTVCFGNMPVQTLNKNIEFEKAHVYTPYGVFGFKIYVFKDFF